MPTPLLRLVVLFGGVSAEHDVSRVTAAHVLAAADRGKYELCLLYTSPSPRD